MVPPLLLLSRMPFAAPPVAERFPEKVTVPPVWPLTSTTLPALVLAIDAATVTVPPPLVTLTPSPVMLPAPPAPIVPPLIAMAPVAPAAPTIETPCALVLSMSTLAKVTVPLPAPLISMPSPEIVPVPIVVAPKLTLAAEPLPMKMPSLPPLVAATLVVPPLNAPPPTLSRLLRLIAMLATMPVLCSDAKLMPLAPALTPVRLMTWPVAVWMLLPVPVTVTVPPPVALKPAPLVVTMSSSLPPAKGAKLIVAPLLLLSVTAVFAPVFRLIVWPVRLTVPPVLLAMLMPRLVSVMLPESAAVPPVRAVASNERDAAPLVAIVPP